MTQADDGISGTNTKKRVGFNQMIADAEAGLFDLILTKEISRFARNSLDSIYYTRLLKSKNIGVHFINDNISTLDPDSELRLTIMASIAQEESRKTSDRVKWGQRRSMEKGMVFGTRVYGYHLSNGRLTIKEAEAEIVKLIYFKYLNEGKGVNTIAKELDITGIPTPTKIKHWTHATLLRILKNEKYIGTLKQKKQITTDYLSHSRKLNEGEEKFIIIENNHPAIIDKETFYSVQDEIAKRRNHKYNKTKYSNRYCFSGKLICGHCGATFKRRINNAKAKNSQIVWECGIYARHGREKINSTGLKLGCNNKSINETTLKNSFLHVLNDFVPEKQSIIQSIESTLKHVLTQNKSSFSQIEKLHENIKRIQSKKKNLIELYTDDMITKEEFRGTSEYLNKQLESYSIEIEQLKAINEQQENTEELIQSIRASISNIVSLQEFSEEVCKAVLDKAIIHSRDNIEFFINENSSNIPLSETQYLQPKVL